MNERHPTRQESAAFKFRKKKRVVVVKKQPHGQVVDDCIRWLFAHGVFCSQNRTGAYTSSYVRERDGQEAHYRVPYGKKGSGDVIGLNRHGVHVEVEAKCRATGDTQRDDQVEHQSRIEE